MTIRGSVLVLAMAIGMISVSSCKKDDPISGPVAELIGEYTGVYSGESCPPGFSIDLEDVSCSITSASSMSVNISLTLGGLGSLGSFKANVQDDSTFMIPTFDANGTPTWGNGSFGNDQVSMTFFDGCMDQGAEISTGAYVGSR